MPSRPTRSQSRRTRPRRPVALGLLVGLAAVVAACGGSDEGGSGGGGRGGSEDGGGGRQVAVADCPVGAHEDAEGKVEVELWHTLSAESQNQLKAIAAEFNGSQDKIEIKVRNQGQSYDEILRKYVAGIPSRQLPAVAYLEDASLRQLVDSGTLVPAESCEKADGFSTGQLPAVRSHFTAEGVYWPGYTNVSVPVNYYNANHFRQAGLDPEKPPETLDELYEMAVALKEEAGVQAPLALILNTGFVESWVTGAGEEMVDQGNGRDGLAEEATFDNPAVRELYAWIDQMVDEGLMEGYSATAGQINQYLAVAQRNSSMAIETSTAATTIKAVLGGEEVEGAPEGIDPGAIDPDAIDPLAGPFPGLEEPGRIRMGGGGFFITNTVPEAEQAAAWEFMKYMWSTEGQVGWHMEGSYLPTTQTAANHPDIQEFWADDLAGSMLQVGYEQLLQADPERPSPQVGPFADYTDAIRNSLDRLVLKRDSVDAVIKGAQEDIQEALDRYIEDNG